MKSWNTVWTRNYTTADGSLGRTCHDNLLKIFINILILIKNDN